MNKIYSLLLFVALVLLSSGANAQQQSYLFANGEVSAVKAEKIGATDYLGFLNIESYNADTHEWESVAVNESKTITITEYTNGTCDFLLPNLYLSSIGTSL